MIKLYIILFIFLLFSSCKNDRSTTTFLTKDNIKANTLWNKITVEENYKKYSFWPGHQGLQPGQSPHGRYHKVFINSILKNALPIKEKIAPYGSIIIKENYSDDKELAGFTIMAKIKDYNKDSGDWFWAKFKKNGQVEAEGKLAKCASCHASTNNDFIILNPLDIVIEK